MDERDIEETLSVVLDCVGGRTFDWRIEGSANLLVQGVYVSVRDLDITTDDDGIIVFREALEDYVIKDFFSEKINGRSLVCDINGFEVEINSYGDREKNLFDKVKVISWKGLDVPVLPLKHARYFYEKIGRHDKAELISKYL